MTPYQKRRAFKLKQFRAKTTAERFLFASVYGQEKVQPFTHGGHKSKIYLLEAEAVADTPLLWKIGCYAICRDTQGRDYIKSMCLQPSEPVKQSVINKALSEAHYDWMRAEVNINHLLTLAWMATTGPKPSDEVAMNIFTEMGAWTDFDYVTATDDGGYVTVPKENAA